MGGWGAGPETSRVNLESPVHLILHVFGLWEEVPGGNPERELNLGPLGSVLLFVIDFISQVVIVNEKLFSTDSPD